MFYLTREPISIDQFHKMEDSDIEQTYFNSLIEDGSDDLISVFFYPSALEGFPRTVEIDFSYYQASVDVKYVQSMTVYLKDYSPDEFYEDGKTLNYDYTLKINYTPLDYFSLINSFQYEIPIYILFFNMVSLILIVMTIILWLLVLICSRRKKPPSVRFKHLARVTFSSPAIGVGLSTIPAVIVALAAYQYQQSTLFESTPSEWTAMGNELSNKEILQIRRGRVGLIFIITGFTFLLFGSNAMIPVPTEEQEFDIRMLQKAAKKREQQEMAAEGEEGAEDFAEEEPYEREEVINISNGLGWKRKHMFIVSIFVTMFLMIKLEFSYKKMFSQNIKLFLLLFMGFDIILENIMVRLVMSEALLVSPIICTFVITEFIMTMGAEDLKAFVISYFIEQSIVVFSRIYIGPWIELLESVTQRVTIRLAMKYEIFKKCFKNILTKQLAGQLQLMSLNEYNQKRLLDADKALANAKKKFEF